MYLDRVGRRTCGCRQMECRCRSDGLADTMRRPSVGRLTMLQILGRPQRLCNGISRRQLLQVGGAGLLGVGATSVAAAEIAGAVRSAPRAKSVMFLYLFGGPSQLETFDMKPDAPSTVQGPFSAIAARTPGMRICEHLPRLAACSDRYAVIRTLNHTQNDHNAAHIICLLYTSPSPRDGLLSRMPSSA